MQRAMPATVAMASNAAPRPAIPDRLLAAAAVLVVAAAPLIAWLPPAAGLVVDDLH